MLRNYQIEICNRIVEALRVHRSVMMQMPTGTGKTVVLASLVNNEESCFNEELGVRKEECILIVAHRRELVEQIRETIRRMGIERAGISVCSIQWLAHNINKVGVTPSLVVIDEAHHALAKTYRMMWEAWPEAKFLGLTATPCRLNRAGFTDLFDTLVCSHSISWFIREKWLSLFDYYSIRAGSEAQRIIDSLEKRGADGDYQVMEMNAVLNRRPSIGRLYESACRYGHNRKGIVYAVSIEHARNIADYYCRHGIRAVAVSSETPKCERERILSLFKDSSFRNCSSFENSPVPSYPEEGLHLSLPNPLFPQEREGLSGAPRAGRGNRACGPADLPLSFSTQQSCDCFIQVLVSVDLFSEGFDCPDVEFIQLARPTLSLAKYLQMVGRGLRKSKGKGSCVIIDNVGLYRLFGLPSADRDWMAMFEGRMAGKAMRTSNNSVCHYAMNISPEINTVNDTGLEKIIDKGGLKTLLERGLTRMKRTAIEGFDMRNVTVTDKGFYVEMFFSSNDSAWYNVVRSVGKYGSLFTACTLAKETTGWYFLCLRLDDGGIIVMDRDLNYYHVEDGKEKRYIGNERSDEEKSQLLSAIKELRDTARRVGERIKADKLKKRLAQLRDVEPFSTNSKWGLRLDGRVIVPPIYHSIKHPVGNYCAVEISPQRWGVIQIDGKLVVNTCYQGAEVMKNGVVNLTVFPGKTIRIKLGK